ncbi:nucleotidyltransferase [Solibacillus silvestris]|uniref:nucleotidyltransferase n=1 Tax=Solibacillus silvestris TaxID=76853 RepID=UPI003F815FC7
MRNISSYSMLFGILIVAFSGNWIIHSYDSVTVYPKASYSMFGIGLVVVICAYMMNRLSVYHEDDYVHKKDNRDALNKWLMDDLPFSRWFIAIIILPLAIAPFYSWTLLFRLFSVYLFSGVVLAGFVYLLKGDRVEEEELDYEGKAKKWLDLIDYRKHPFNISLFIYILVIASFVLSKQLGIPLYMETGGNPRYVASLPSMAFLMSILMVVSTFIFIINHGDIFGFRKAEQSNYRVMFIHFAEIIQCGVTFFLLVFTVLNALYVYF